MKKIFSLFAAVLFAGSMMADSYVKVTEAPTDWAGDYLIVYEAGNVAFDGSLTTLDGASNTVAVTISEGAIAATDALNAAKFTIAKVDGGYSLQSASGKFIGVTGNSNGLKQADEVGDYTHDLSIDESGNAVIKANFSGSTMYLRYNKASNQLRFRYYKNAGQEAIALYKFAAGGDTPQEDTWTVAGSSTVAFGTSWDPTNTANDMVKQNDGTFKWEKENLELAAGSVNFKVAKNHSWDEAYPSQDYNLAIDAAGIYTITITFEPDNSNKVSAIATKTGEAVVVPTVIMHGTFSGSWADTEAFATADDKKTASLKLTLAASDIEFGLKLDGAWKANGATITRENASTSLASGNGNMHLTADVDGDYTFTYTYETQTLEVTFPKIITVMTCAEAAEAAATAGDEIYKAKGYVTEIAYALSNGSMSFWMADTEDGGRVLEAYKCAVADEADAPKVGDLVIVTGQLTVYQSTKEFKQGCTVEIVERAAEPVNLGEKTIAEFLALKNTKDTCVLTGKVIEIVNDQYGNLTIEDATGSLYVYGVLTPAGESKKFSTLDVAVNDVLTIKATYNEFNGNPQAKNAIFVSREKATPSAIDNATVAGKAQKMIIDGQLFIIRDGVMFNANGAAVK